LTCVDEKKKKKEMSRVKKKAENVVDAIKSKNNSV